MKIYLFSLAIPDLELGLKNRWRDPSERVFVESFPLIVHCLYSGFRTPALRDLLIEAHTSRAAWELHVNKDIFVSRLAAPCSSQEAFPQPDKNSLGICLFLKLARAFAFVEYLSEEIGEYSSHIEQLSKSLAEFYLCFQGTSVNSSRNVFRFARYFPTSSCL